MSKVSELIKELCPNGVKFYKIKEVSSVTIGEFVHKNKQSDDGKYPVYNGGTSNTGFYDEYNNDGHKVIISARGANAGFINRVKGKYWAGNSCYTININDESQLDWNYLYQYLKNNQSILLGVQQTGSIPAISKKQVEEFKIVIPPLEVQKEIVRILDKFGQLEAELEAELEARKSQYDFWRGNLFQLKDVKEYKFSDLAKLITKQTGFDYTNHIKKSLINEKNDNTLPYIQTKFFAGKRFDYDTDYYIPKEVANRFNKILLNDRCILLSIVGASIGNVGLFDGTVESFLGGAIGLVKLNDDVNIDYIYHYLQSPYGQNQIRNNIKGSGQASLTIESIREFTIPVPSLEEQSKIVKILDRFDMLVNDITVGLPAEIELRRKQYEYYRNKLLSFEELSVSE